MKTGVSLIAVPLVAALAWVVPARAEERGEPATTLRFNLRLGADTFAMNGSLLGPAGMFRARLNGRLSPDGLALDGELQRDAQTLSFGLDARADGRDGLRARVDTP